MVSKPKKRQVPKVSSATQEQQTSLKVDKEKPVSPESLIRYNGELVEQLFSSKAWKEIVQPLFEESIAGVSGRFTNGRYWHGTLTSDWKGDNPLFVAGYQKGLMDLYNHLHDFIQAKEKLKSQKKLEELEKKAPIYNPFLEELNND